MYKPKLFRRFALTSLVLRGINNLLGLWPLALMAALILSPVGPHLRIQYDYRDLGGGRKAMISCQYFGSRGMVRAPFGHECGVIAIIDARKLR